MKIHIENLNTELDGIFFIFYLNTVYIYIFFLIFNTNMFYLGMDKTEKQFDGVTDIQCSHFHSWFSYAPLSSINSNIQSSPTLSQNENIHQDYFMQEFNSIYSKLTIS